MKKYLIVGALVIAFVLPSISSAATLEELQAQINALLAQIQQLQTQLAQVQGTLPAQWCHNFNVNLKIGDRGSEVAALQQALEKEGFQISTEIELGPASVFNEVIASVVTGFQEKYKSEILTPLNLQYGTGFVGTATRAKLNRLYGCNVLPFLFPSSTPSITVISPNGGESIPTGLDNYIIRYSVSNIGQIINPGIRIEVLQNGIVLGYRCVSSSGVCGVSRDPTNWNFSWDVGSYTNADGSTYQKASVGAGYQIRVVLFDGNIEIARDTSNAPFNIIATALTQPFTVLSSPNGREQWQIGGTYTIRWNTTLDVSKTVQIGLVDTRYSSEVGARGEAIIAFSTSNTGSYNWTIPAMLGTMDLTVTNQPVYKIKLYVDGGGSGKFDDSDAAFSIVAAGNQAPRIISATFDGNGVVIQGERLTGSYVVFVVPPSGVLCREMITPNCILQKTLSTDTTIKFNSNWIGGEGSYRIYVENPTTGESNSVYMTISSTSSISSTPSITVLSPNGGEQLIKGQTFDIRWSSQNIPAGTLVTVSLYHGATGSRRNQFVSIANDGIERWTINSPEAEDGTYKITLEAGCNSYGTNCLATDQSDAAFSIVAAAVSQSTSLSIISVSPFIFPSKNIIVGSTGIEVAKFTLTTGSAADANISSIQLKSTNTAVCSSLQNLKLYVDASQIGQTIPVLDSSCTATFGNLSWVLLKSVSKDVTLKLDVANSAQVGSNFSFQLSGITSSNAQVSGLGATSGAIMTIVSAAAVSQSTSLDQMASILNSIQETLNKIQEALKNL